VIAAVIAVAVVGSLVLMPMRPAACAPGFNQPRPPSTPGRVRTGLTDFRRSSALMISMPRWAARAADAAAGRSRGPQPGLPATFGALDVAEALGLAAGDMLMVSVSVFLAGGEEGETVA
jgi:hypothetical protein